jgi:hypothetical protein
MNQLWEQASRSIDRNETGDLLRIWRQSFNYGRDGTELRRRIEDKIDMTFEEYLDQQDEKQYNLYTGTPDERLRGLVYRGNLPGIRAAIKNGARDWREALEVAVRADNRELVKFFVKLDAWGSFRTLRKIKDGHAFKFILSELIGSYTYTVPKTRREELKLYFSMKGRDWATIAWLNPSVEFVEFDYFHSAVELVAAYFREEKPEWIPLLLNVMELGYMKFASKKELEEEYDRFLSVSMDSKKMESIFDKLMRKPFEPKNSMRKAIIIKDKFMVIKFSKKIRDLTDFVLYAAKRNDLDITKRLVEEGRFDLQKIRSVLTGSANEAEQYLLNLK